MSATTVEPVEPRENDRARVDPRVKSRWIVSAPFDLVWFFGGSIASLAMVLAFFAMRVPIMMLVWIGILVFDGPHMAAAYTRTYVDRSEWRARPRVLITPLLFGFLLGPLMLFLDVVTKSEWPFLAFLGGVTFYAYFHVVRQHYGFLALYKSKAGERSRVDFLVDKVTLYVGCWAPYGWFLINHPKARVLVRLPAELGLWEPIVSAIIVVAYLASLAAFLLRALRSKPLNPQKIGYFLITVLLYAAAYFWVARYEPVYSRSTGPDQDFLLLSLVIAVFHNVQYVGLVWFHNKNRYAERRAEHGLARWVNRSIAPYLFACAAFSFGVYFLIACATGVYPGCQAFLDRRLYGSITVNQLGLSLWWGVALHHYYLDQKIWRIRGDAELRKNLGLA